MKIGILGAGWGARVQLPVLRHAGFSEILLWGRSPDKARANALKLEALKKQVVKNY